MNYGILYKKSTDEDKNYFYFRENYLIIYYDTSMIFLDYSKTIIFLQFRNLYPNKKNVTSIEDNSSITIHD
jgi:hypothetical protein|tara:strand:- start:913 stop:1125 length:213 start_codon:yes stop_codon:yes gene_type:complete